MDPPHPRPWGSPPTSSQVPSAWRRWTSTAPSRRIGSLGTNSRWDVTGYQEVLKEWCPFSQEHHFRREGEEVVYP